MAAVVLGACAAVVIRTIPSGSSPSSPSSPHSVSLPADGRSRATLQVVTGVPVLTVGVANLGASGTLLRVSTPAGSPAPQLRVTGGASGQIQTGNAHVSLSAKGASAVTVTLNAAVSWQLDFAGRHQADRRRPARRPGGGHHGHEGL